MSDTDPVLLGLIASLLAGLVYGVAAVGQAAAARRLPPASAGVRNLLMTAFRSPLLIGMGAAYLVGAGLHLVAIDHAPLYIAQTGIAAALPVTAITSALVLRERFRPADWVAVVAAFTGVAVVAADAGEAGTTHRQAIFVAGLYVALAVIVGLALFAYRHRGRASAIVLSLLGGLCYSATTLSARELGSPDWSVLSVLLILVLGTFGLLGFCLYSFAMQRVSVAAASAPLILTETLVPTVVGIALLGDGVPSGWTVVLGLALALAGAVYLAGFEGRAIEPAPIQGGA